MGVLTDAAVWGVVWAMFAAAAGLSLAVAAKALWRNLRDIEALELNGGYNALGAALDR